MKIVKQNEFRQKVEVIINALLSHDITREHAVKCLSSVVIVLNDAVTAQAIEQAEKIMTRHGNDSEEFEFQLAFGTESLPFMTEDVKNRWEKLAGLDVIDAEPMHLGVAGVDGGPPPPSTR